MFLKVDYYIKLLNQFGIKINKHKVNAKKIFALTIIITSMILTSNSKILTMIFNIVGLEHYNGYISGNMTFLFSKIIKILPIAFIFILRRKEFIAKKNSWFYILMFLIGTVIVAQFSSVNAYGERIGYLFQIYNLISFTMLCNCAINIKQKRAIKMFVIAYMLISWEYFFAYGGVGETVPYITYWN